MRGSPHQLSYYLANKRSLHVRSQGLEIPTLIGEKRKIKITHHCHYEKNQPKIPIYMFIICPPVPLKYISIYKYKSIHRFAYQATYRVYLQDTSYTIKRSLHIRSQGLEISMLIGGKKRKIKITHHYHYEKLA